MEKSDKTRFAELITGLAQTFQTPISASDLENYWQFLRHYSLTAIELAVVNYCRSPEAHRFLPKPGEIVAQIQGGSVGQALRAWAKVRRAVSQLGTYRTVVFDDPLIHVVVWDMGGWQSLCAMTIKDEPFKAREFEKRYVSYLANPPSAYPKQLTGIIDAVNVAHGYDGLSPVTLVGDEQQALQVLKNGKEPSRMLSIKELLPRQLTHLLLQKKPEEN